MNTRPVVAAGPGFKIAIDLSNGKSQLMQRYIIRHPINPPMIYDIIIEIAVQKFARRSFEPLLINIDNVIAGFTCPPHIGDRNRI